VIKEDEIIAFSLRLWNFTLQRNNTENSKQIFPEKELPGHSPISTFVCLWATICTHDRSAYFSAGKYVDRSWEYTYNSLTVTTHEYRNWDWGRAIPRKEIQKNGFSFLFEIFNGTCLFFNVPLLCRFFRICMHLKFIDRIKWTWKLTKYGEGVEKGVLSVGVPCQAAVVSSILQKTRNNYPENNIIPTSKQKKWMRSSRVVRASDCHSQSRNS
jgi:hypothetical protein